MTKIFGRNFTEKEFQSKENETDNIIQCVLVRYTWYNSLCRPIVFCEYEAYENCAFKPFSTCESCR